ncbi:hypothetical protein PBY51_013786 [Eleginops maclovinus]|uniref:Uncharacterized protein n=1 Tax=Eleginops maclovinus TaxID=56733 RepID=A0AAN8AXY6_ELEMC|nr:hypothetical protein PBY51_013786 [Eleginops maclovinus]
MFGFRLQFLFLLTFSGATLGQEPGAVRVVVPEGGGDAVLPVSIGRNAERLFFDWRKPRQTFYVELDVAATPKPSVTTLTATADCSPLGKLIRFDRDSALEEVICFYKDSDLEEVICFYKGSLLDGVIRFYKGSRQEGVIHFYKGGV